MTRLITFLFLLPCLVYAQADKRPAFSHRSTLATLRSVANGPEEDSITARAAYFLGDRLQFSDQFVEARSVLNRAITLHDSLLSDHFEARALCRLALAGGVFATDQERAEELLAEALEIAGTNGKPSATVLARSYVVTAELMVQRGKFQEAIANLRLALPLLKDLPPSESRTAGNVNSDLAFQLMANGQSEPEGYTRVRAAIRTAERADDLEALLNHRMVLAILYANGEKNEKAKEIFLDNIERTLPVSELQIHLGGHYHNLAVVYSRSGQKEKALAAIRQSVEYSRKYLPESVRFGRYMEGNLLNDLKRPAESLVALDQSVRAFGDTAFVERGSRPFLRLFPAQNLNMAIQLYGVRGETQIALGDTLAAVEDFVEVLNVRDYQRGRSPAPASQRYWSRQFTDFNDMAIELLLANPTQERTWQALELSERIKGQALVQELDRRREFGPGQDTLLNRIAELERIIDPTPSETDHLNRLLLDRAERYDAVAESYQPRSVTSARLRKFVLETKRNIAAFYLGKQRAYRFDLQADGRISAIQLLDSDSLVVTVEAWRATIKEGAYRRKTLLTRREQASLDSNYLALGVQLRQQLLPEKLPEGDWLIVPDGVLHFLPFSALPTVETAELPLDFTRLPVFREGRPLMLAPSLAYLAAYGNRLKANKVKFDRDLLAMAPTFEGEAGPQLISELRGGRATGNLPSLLPLLHNHTEVERVAEHFTVSQILTGAGASLRAFLHGAPGSRIIHLSSHGMVNAVDPNLSFIAFSQRGDSISETELLFYNDLPALSLNADLVVLSACQTSLGNVAAGSGVLSLGAAFSAAGARSVMATLWQVDDEATTTLIAKFYDELAAGTERAAALHAAQGLLSESPDYAHPYYWSGIVMSGVDGPMELGGVTDSWKWWIYGGISVLLLLGATGWYTKLRSDAPHP